MYTQSEESILPNEVVLAPASTGKRLANYIIDLIVFYALAFVVGVLLVVFFGPDVLDYDETTASGFLDRIISLIAYGILLGLIEGFCKGKTLGKLITGTRAVTEDGKPVDFAHGFKRGLIRIVPFNPFSAFGSPSYPWHDKWSNTLVIDEKLSDTSGLSGN